MKDLVWYDRLQLVAMMLMAASMPVDFHCGLWAGVLLAVASLVKMVAQRRVGNRSLSRPLVWTLVAIVAYWLLHLISVAYGGQPEVGLRVVELKAVLLLFALSFLLSDTGYIREHHIRWLFCSLWVSVCAVFVYHLCAALLNLFDGASPASVFGMNFDKRHHAYTALYIDVALGFLLVELSTRCGSLRRWLRVAMLVSAPFLVLYVLMVNSRAGVLAMWMVALAGVLYLLLVGFRWKQALLLALLFSAFTLGAGQLLPGHDNRLASTLENVSDVVASDDGASDDEADITPDARLDILKSTVGLAMERPLTGFGASRYRAAIVQRFEDDGFDYGVKSGFNAHNQYVETMLSVGVVGLLFLLAFLLVPIWQAWRGRRYLFPVLLLIAVFGFNLLFESMLERQMGLLFICFFVPVIVLLISTEENKFGQYPKK